MSLTTTLLALAATTVVGVGIAAAQTRFPIIQPADMNAEQKKLFDTLVAGPRAQNYGGEAAKRVLGGGPFNAWMRSPEFGMRIQAVGEHIRFKSAIPKHLNELAILITAREWTAQYEWFAHYPLALKGGLDPKVADAIAAGKRPDSMKDDEAALYDLATALYRDRKVSDPIYKAALEKFGESGIMDIIGIIGYYDLVSMTLITMQAEAPNDSVKPLPVLTK